MDTTRIRHDEVIFVIMVRDSLRMSLYKIVIKRKLEGRRRKRGS